MLDFILKMKNGSLQIGEKGQIYFSDELLSHLLNRLGATGLSTVGARIKTVKRIFSIQSKVPIFLHKSLLLFPLSSMRSEQSSLVNYYAIRSFEKSGSKAVNIFFLDGLELTSKSFLVFKKQMKVCEAIHKYLLEIEEWQENAFIGRNPHFLSGNSHGIIV